MKEKRGNVLTIRITDDILQKIQKEADKREWTLSQTAYYILRVYLEESYRKEENPSDN